MNNIKGYADFILEVKSERDVVKDLARHLAFDKDIIKYLNTSRAKRTMGWRELLDDKLHGKNKDYINYITKNMVADYNPQITGYIHINDPEEGDFDKEQEENKEHEFDSLSLDDKLNDLNKRIGDIETIFGVDPDDDRTPDAVSKAMKDINYVVPELEPKEKDVE